MQTLPLGDALFTATQQKVPGLLYGKPDQSYHANEIARWAQPIPTNWIPAFAGMTTLWWRYSFSSTNPPCSAE